MVELGPKNEWIGLPFRNWEKQAIRSCGFLRFIGPSINLFCWLPFLVLQQTPDKHNKGREGFVLVQSEGIFYCGGVVWCQGLEATAHASGSREVNAGT